MSRFKYHYPLFAGLFVAAAAANAATPATVYQGGGATVPASGLLGQFSLLTNPDTAPAYSTGGGQVSALGYYLNRVVGNPASTGLSYCRTGGASGNKVFDGQSAASSRCALLPLVSESIPGLGFGASGQSFADFAATDFPLNAGEYSTYLSNAATAGSNIHGRGEPVQVPATVASIGILYNNADVSTRLVIRTVQLCEIFDGEITDWNQLNSSLPSKPITVVYRGDASAASFAFSNHLNASCPTPYGVSAKFKDALPSPLPAGASTANFIPAAGNAVETSLVSWKDGAIGFVETANSLSAVSGSVQLAFVNHTDPVADLPAAANDIVTANLVADQAIGASVPNGRPALVPLSPTTPGCTLLVDPASYANPIDGYPIVAVSYLNLSSAGNGAKATDLRSLASFLAQPSTFSGITPVVNTIDAASGFLGIGTTGLASLPLDGSYASLLQSVANNCVGN